MKNLINIQNELKVPKGNYNSFGKYKYRSAEDILEAIKPVLKKYNAVLVLTDSIEQIGSKLYLKATAMLSIDNEKISVNGFAEMGEHKGMSSEQCTGTASSYARKYSLNGLFLIDETESDADNENVKPVQQTWTLDKAEASLKAATTSDILVKIFKGLPLEIQQKTKELASELNKKLESNKK